MPRHTNKKKNLPQLNSTAHNPTSHSPIPHPQAINHYSHPLYRKTYPASRSLLSLSTSPHPTPPMPPSRQKATIPYETPILNSSIHLSTLVRTLSISVSGQNFRLIDDTKPPSKSFYVLNLPSRMPEKALKASKTMTRIKHRA